MAWMFPRSERLKVFWFFSSEKNILLPAAFPAMRTTALALIAVSACLFGANSAAGSPPVLFAPASLALRGRHRQDCASHYRSAHAPSIVFRVMSRPRTSRRHGPSR
jgi:hypothetical protein